jgi:hypothetical protein
MSKVISVEEILQDLENGLTRKPNSVGYNPAVGSVSEKYGLDNSEVNLLFNHPDLKGKKTKKLAGLVIVRTVEEKNAALERLNNQDDSISSQELVDEEIDEEIEEVIEEISVTLPPQIDDVVTDNSVTEEQSGAPLPVESEEDSLF